MKNRKRKFNGSSPFRKIHNAYTLTEKITSLHTDLILFYTQKFERRYPHRFWIVPEDKYRARLYTNKKKLIIHMIL